MTIKAKAWKAWLGDLDVEVSYLVGENLIKWTGLIRYLSIDCLLRRGQSEIRYTDITEIRFVDEQVADGEEKERTELDYRLGDGEWHHLVVSGDGVYVDGLRYTRDEPYDIAKERWKRDEDGDIRIDVEDGSRSCLIADGVTEAQTELAAAAPELADKMREILNLLEPHWIDNLLGDCVPEAIRLLRKLNVPNVAPWYPDDDVKG